MVLYRFDCGAHRRKGSGFHLRCQNLGIALEFMHVLHVLHHCLYHVYVYLVQLGYLISRQPANRLCTIVCVEISAMSLESRLNEKLPEHN